MPTTREFGWGRVALYGFCVFLPAVAVGISNYYVFRDSFWMATMMLLITMGIAAIFTYYSDRAIWRVRRFCVLADLAICVILCINLGSHWALAREVSGAKESVVERHTEEDREEARKNAEADRLAKLTAEQRELTKQQGELAKQESQRFRNEAIRNDSARRLGVIPRQLNPFSRTAPAPAATIAPTIGPTSAPGGKKQTEPTLTPEEIRTNWNPFLTILAYVECLVSVLAGGILAVVWEWDRNRNGIPDRLEGNYVQPRLTGAQPVEGFARGTQNVNLNDLPPDVRKLLEFLQIDPSNARIQTQDFQQRNPVQRRSWLRRLFNR